MDDICSHLKISKKTLYQYFSNKDDLVEQIMMHRRNNYRTQKDIEELKQHNSVEIHVDDQRPYHPELQQQDAGEFIRFKENTIRMFINE